MEQLINTPSPDRFKDKVVFITGGAGGIGVGMAKAFAEHGAKVAIADVAASALDAATEQLAALGVEALALPLDVTDRDAVQAAAEKVVAHFGAVHIVCANAGVAGHIGPLQNTRHHDWDWIIDVNLKGTINTVQTFLPYLMKNPANESHIVITSSISGLRVHQPSRGQGTYNMTKYALMGYGEALNVDLQPLGISVSLLCPGVVATNLSHSGENRPDRYGGAFKAPADFELAKVASQGTDPLRYGRWVVNAVARRQLYVITHTAERFEVEDRHRRIEEAFDASAELTQG
jgi:NAD(P)-dependent dehydrogenase (short-subunit alcohol dehydrogenase family)